MTLEDYLNALENSPTTLDFADTIAVIDATYDFTPTEFKNGDTVNEEGQNNGSCKVFSFAIEQDLDESQTLSMFAQYYRKDVLGNLAGDDHQNIRQFMKHGFEGLEFVTKPLALKA